jgi:hypothetical protein
VLPIVAKSIEPAFARFDLDHFRAVTGEQSSCIRAGITGGERHDTHAFEDLVGSMHEIIPDLLES